MDSPNQENPEKTRISRILPGTTEIGQFRILSQIGAGGMGEVYLALDKQLQREVALKLLPSSISDDPDTKARFLREAQTAAALNHPNIVTIFQIGEHQGQSYIAMEHIEGMSLKDIIKSQTLTFEKISGWIYQICEGLSAAHEKGIVHRDIKPANILVTNLGRIKLLDFGLAKFYKSSGLTQTGMRLGTVTYMSPEQAQGLEVDHRSDIFSLGVIIYEMLTGNLPFQRDNEISTLYAIVHQNHISPAEIRADVPREFIRVVDFALQKRPEKRYQSIKELMRDFWGEMVGPVIAETQIVAAQPLPSAARQPSRGSDLSFVRTGVRKLSIAVLPFDNLGPTDQEYFAAGISEEITTSLAKLKQLRVISHNSARHFKHKDDSLTTIGRELGVDYLLTGSIRWDKSGAASRFRLSCKLVDATDESLLWAETYDRVLDQIFALQSELAEQVTKALGVVILEPELKSIGATLTNNLEAYDFYLKGNEFFPRSTSDTDLRKAIEFYEKAVELDSDFAVAYAKMSWAHSTMYWFHHDRSQNRFNDARNSAEKAMALLPDSAESNLAMGYFHYYGELNYDLALERFAVALQSRPNDSNLLAATSFINRRKGNWEQARQGLRRASTLDPKSSLLAFELGVTLVIMRSYNEALAHLDRAIWLAPDWVDAYARKAQAYLLRNGDLQEAVAVFRTAEEKFNPAEMVTEWELLDAFIAYCGDHAGAISRLAVDETETETYFLHKGRLARLMGNSGEAKSYFETAAAILKAKVNAEPNNARAWSFLGVAYAGLGQKEKAIEAGRKATDQFPFEKDKVFSVVYRATLAYIYALLDEPESAIEEFAFILSVPSYISKEWLKAGAEFAALRESPRFQELVQ